MAPKKDPKPKKEESSESPLQSKIDAIEKQKTDLEMQIAFLTEKLSRASEERAVYQKRAEEFRTTLEETKQNYDDILAHHTLQAKSDEKKADDLIRRVEQLEGQMKAKDERICVLEVQSQKDKEILKECDSALEDRQKLEQLVKSQQSMIEKQSKEIDRFVHKNEDILAENAACRDQISDLTLQAADKTDVSILFDDVCFITHRCRTVAGDIPPDSKSSSLVCVGGEKLVLCGEMVGLFKIHSFDLSTFSWTKHDRNSNLPFLSRRGHAMCPFSRSKLILYGGFQNSEICSDVSILNSETLNWQRVDLIQLVAPKPRHKHACCTSRDQLFVFGGVVDGELTNELWILDIEVFQWHELIGYEDEPSPRRESTIAVSEDGKRLYVFGGYDGQQDLNDLYTLDIEKRTWTAVQTEGRLPEPRRSHISSILTSYLLIAGGMTKKRDSDGWRNLGDCHVLDLSTSTWETIDDGTWIAEYPWMHTVGKEGSYMTFWDNQLFTLRPDRRNRLSQIGIVQFVLPTEIANMRVTKKKENHIQSTLDIVAIKSTAHTMSVQWRPPTKNVERIDYYKLMLATHTGSVACVYEGKERQYKIVRLRQNAEYILCVKAVYDDGSFVWSESKAQRTRCAA